MEPELFAVRLDRPLSVAETRALLRVMPDARRARLRRAPNAASGEEALCAYAALYLMTRKRYGWRVLPKLCYNRYGKPAFAEHPDIHFSISHTDRAVLVGLHDEPLGVDIERLRPVSERMTRRFAGTASPHRFWETWVQREACAKRDGVGIFSARESPQDGRFVPLDTFPGYFAGLSTRSAVPIPAVRRLVID